MKKLLIIAAICLPVFVGTTFGQSLNDTLVLQSSLTTVPATGATYQLAPGGYIYNGSGFGGSVFVGPRFRQTNLQALMNENNGIAHGNNLGLFPSSTGNESRPLFISTLGSSSKLSKGMMIKTKMRSSSGLTRTVKMRKIKRLSRVKTTSI